MLTYITIVLFIIILFFDYQYKNHNLVLPSKEHMHGGGGGGSRGSNLSELNNDTLADSMSDVLTDVSLTQNRAEKKTSDEIQDVIGSMYDPPFKPDIEGYKAGIEGYTSYNNFSFAMSNSPPLSINNSTNTNQSGSPYYKQNFQNFTKFGKIPPNPVATTCFLDFDCVNYPYNSDERNGNVCKRCVPNPLKQNYDKSATYVMGREAGMPRQIRKIF